MNIVEILDIDAPELAPFSKLTDHALRAKYEPEKGLFIAESATVTGVALDAGFVPLSCLIQRNRIDTEKELLARIESLPGGDKIPIYTADDALLEKLCGFPLSRGFFAAFPRPKLPDPRDLLARSSRIAVLEGVVDPTNVGAILRSAAGLGIDAVLLSPSCSDPLRRRALRVSMGTSLLLPWTYLAETPAEWQKSATARLREYGFTSVALALRDDALPLSDPRLREIKKLAVILGAEGDGLSEGIISGSDYTVKIPMARGVDSLNVAAASALAFWELRAR